jgi:hypothetical protein
MERVRNPKRRDSAASAMRRASSWPMSNGKSGPMESSMASKPADFAWAKHSARGISFGKMMEQIPLVNRGPGCGSGWALAEKTAAASGAARA